MANSKISALTSATTPLVGTETLPIVQGGATVKTTVADITNGGGYAGSFTSLAYTTTLTGGTGIVNLGSGQFYKNATGNVGIANTLSLSNPVGGTTTFADPDGSTVDGYLRIGNETSTTNRNSVLELIGYGGNGGGTFGGGAIVFTNTRYGSSSSPSFSQVAAITGKRDGNGTGLLKFWTGSTTALVERMRISGAGGVSIGSTTDAGVGNLLMGTGNVTQGTAAKGFDFSANTPLAGKTSTLLNWYEEGTWTPNQGAGLTLVGAFSSTGRYTRIGRQVSISGTVTGATSVAVTAAGVITSNLPFTVVTAGHGGATNVANTASATVICTSTSVTSAAAIAATGTITFSATYFV
jgi:hypothetical protein